MSLETYYTRLHQYQTYSSNYKVFLEVEKCCGYGEFVCVFKKDTLSEVSKMISKTFDYEARRLYVKDQSGNILDLPLNSEEKLRDFMARNTRFFTPVYPLPANVVYKVYYEYDMNHDSCCHNTNIDNNNNNHNNNNG